MDKDILRLHLQLIDRVWAILQHYALSQVGRVAHLVAMLGQLLVRYYLDLAFVIIASDAKAASILRCSVGGPLDFEVHALQVLLQVLLLADLLRDELLLSRQLHALLRM